jgi:hypothetical protein
MSHSSGNNLKIVLLLLHLLFDTFVVDVVLLVHVNVQLFASFALGRQLVQDGVFTLRVAKSKFIILIVIDGGNLL